ncbi:MULTISPECIES: hypothetical protein [Methylobacterium]|nr:MULTISPECIES: hypothetical protein [Methylobacterium]MCI9882844.1 hypothetical protein [Methylobacterium goesingense]
MGTQHSRMVGLATVLCAAATAAPADDGRGLRRTRDPNRVGLSGLSPVT